MLFGADQEKVMEAGSMSAGMRTNNKELIYLAVVRMRAFTVAGEKKYVKPLDFLYKLTVNYDWISS